MPLRTVGALRANKSASAAKLGGCWPGLRQEPGSAAADSQARAMMHLTSPWETGSPRQPPRLTMIVALWRRGWKEMTSRIARSRTLARSVPSGETVGRNGPANLRTNRWMWMAEYGTTTLITASRSSSSPPTGMKRAIGGERMVGWRGPVAPIVKAIGKSGSFTRASDQHRPR